MSFIDDFTDANRSFSPFRAELLKHIKGDKIIDVETDGGTIASLFDKYSGIDAIQVVNGQLRTIAMRVQWGVNYQSFTIRYKRKSGVDTEYKKRIDAIFGQKGYLFPYLTVQCYLDKRHGATGVLSCAIVKTEDLYKFIKENFDNLQKRKCPEGNEFLVVYFQQLIESGIKSIVFGDNPTFAPTSNAMRIAK